MAGKGDVCVQPKKDLKSLERRALRYQHVLSGRKTGSFQERFNHWMRFSFISAQVPSEEN